MMLNQSQLNLLHFAWSHTENLGMQGYQNKLNPGISKLKAPTRASDFFSRLVG